VNHYPDISPQLKAADSWLDHQDLQAPTPSLIPEEGRPDYLIYWLRDACLGYHAWLGELEKVGNKDVALCAIVDDIVHALIRTQHLIVPPKIFSKVDWGRLFSTFKSTKLRTPIIVLVLPQLVGRLPILPPSNV
jgi:hypothetical protein